MTGPLPEVPLRSPFTAESRTSWGAGFDYELGKGLAVGAAYHLALEPGETEDSSDFVGHEAEAGVEWHRGGTLAGAQLQYLDAFENGYTALRVFGRQSFGPLFRDLHHLFDELAKEVQATLDELAERVRMIGQDPIATPAEVMEAASVKPARLGQTMREMAEEANAHAVRVIREMREAVEAAEEAKDPGSVDLFSRFVQIHEIDIP